MKIEFEAYLYDERKQDPYEVSYSVACETLDEAVQYAMYDYNDYCKHGWDNYGGAVIVVDGKVVYDAFPSGHVEIHDKSIEKLFDAE